MLLNVGGMYYNCIVDKTFETKSKMHVYTANIMMLCVLSCYRPHSCGGLIYRDGGHCTRFLFTDCR